MSALNLAVRFACECALVGVLLWWGWALAGLVAAAVVVGIWAVLVAPKARRRLPDPPRLVLELVLFACGTAALVAVGHATLAGVFGLLAVVSAVLVRRWPEPV